MNISKRRADNTLIISVEGRIDALTAGDFDSFVSTTLEGGDEILILNMSALEYISSTGLRVILATAKKLKNKHGDLYLVGLRGNVRKTFKISGFFSIFKVFEDEQAALEAR